MIKTFKIFENSEYDGLDVDFFDDHIDIDLSNIPNDIFISLDKRDKYFDKINDVLKNKIVSFHVTSVLLNTKLIKGQFILIMLTQSDIGHKIKIAIKIDDPLLCAKLNVPFLTKAYKIDPSYPLTVHTLESDVNKYNL